MNKQLFSLAIFMLFLGLFAEQANAQASGVKPELIMYRHNGGGITPSPVLSGNILGTLKWNGLTAIGNIQTGASIKSVITGGVSAGNMPSNMIFSTNNGVSLNERMVIVSTGLVGIGTMNPQYHLDIVGNTHTSGRFFGRIHYDFGEPTDLPSSYLDESYFERKSRAQLGLGANTYANGGILSLAPGGGSLDRQLFSGGDDGFWTRSQDLGGADAWAAWEKILTSGDIAGRPNLVARFLPPGPTSSKLSDGQVFDNGNNVVIGGIPAAPAVPAPVFNASDMLTVKGNFRTDGNLRATGNASVDGNATVTGNTTSGSLNVTTNATVTGNTTTGSLNVSTNATVNANTTTSSLNVTNNASVSGNVGIGKAATGFDLDVAGQSNFDGRVKVGAASFPTAVSYELAVGGGIIAEEVLVQLEGAWADYVFEQGYKLQPLAEVASFIAQEKHLPGVSSAKEVAQNGLNLGEMQKAQMEKIEELYLHLIALDKELNAIKAENASLKATVEQLKQRN